MHARRATERIHAQTGVISQRRQARGAAGVARLGKRVLEKGGMRLIGLADTERRLRDDLDGKGREDGADFPQLAGIPRRQNQLHSPKARFWC